MCNSEPGRVKRPPTFRSTYPPLGKEREVDDIRGILDMGVGTKL